MDQLPRRHVVSDPEKKSRVVQEAYRTVGALMDSLSEPALLVDALCMDGPIVGATAGFLELTGYERKDLLGMNCRLMLRGVPEVAISKSARKNIRDYCGMCQIAGLKEIGETNAVQPNSRQDGSLFVNLFILGLCMVQGHPYILSVQIPMGEGIFVRLKQVESNEAVEKARNEFKRIRDILRTGGGSTSIDAEMVDTAVPSYLYKPMPSRPDFAFYADRLQDHCLLINDGFTAIRREPDELATNCLVYGNQPVRHTAEGLSFSVRLDQVIKSFVGLPVLGFTRRAPKDEPGLYPAVSRCLGASVLVGGCGDAWVRDKSQHFEMGFKQPPPTEVEAFTSQPDVPIQRRTIPCNIAAGDVLQCLYTWDGHIQLMANDVKILDFQTGRPVDGGSDYYAVVDVCFSAYCITLLPSSEPSTTGDTTEELDAHERFLRESSFASEDSFVSASPSADNHNQSSFASAGVSTSVARTMPEEEFMDMLVKSVVINSSIKAAVAECSFCVTIADPKAPDCPLIAVSEEFERMTGFFRHEALGVNCRFLNQGCECNPMDLLNLRISSETGAPFTAVLPNRKKSGEMFLNLLDLRGLSVAKDPATGEDIWFLIGIQADVTDMTDEDVPEDHMKQMQLLADSIRASVAQELSEFAVSGARQVSDQIGVKLPTPVGGKDKSCRLLNRPEWRPGAALGTRNPDDAPVKEMVGLVYNSKADSNWLSQSKPAQAVEQSDVAATPQSRFTGRLPLSLSAAVLIGVALVAVVKVARR